MNKDNEKQDVRFDKIDVQLDKIVTAVVTGFDRLDKTLETKADKQDIERLINLIDALSKRVEISDDERIVMGHQLTRLHDWVEQAAKRIDLEFTH